MKEFTLEELSRCNGMNGKPVYVAHQGRIFDISESTLWKGGIHMKRHQAGKDLTADIQAAPHTPENLERFPQVGIVKKEPVLERAMPKILSRVVDHFPILRRHPHPMVVHFPIAFMFSATIFNVLYLLTGITSFEITALHCLGGGILFTPVAMITGWFTWWLNYMAKPMLPVTMKTWFSVILLLFQLIAFIWRILVPEVVTFRHSASLIYFLLTLSFIPLVTVIGWFGATLTFPVERK
ncbi:MAG: DUF2231 domain-containing protein [Pseudomonadota bacterium]